MAILRLAILMSNALGDAVTQRIDGADDPGTMTFYTGRMPGNPDEDVTDQVLLGVLTFSKPAAKPADLGVVSYTDIAEDSSAAETGRATWARVSDGDGNAVLDVDVTGIGEGGTVELNTVQIVKGGPIRMSTFVLRYPTA